VEAGLVDDFIVARNPDASRLPYLVRLPIDGGLWLKAKEPWPRAARVFCQPAEAPRTENLDIVERVAVQSCVRRGVAIDLVLARAHNRRSQFVTTTVRGRPMIFWQTPKVATTARPGLRIPYGTVSPLETIYVDTRERYGYTFRNHDARVERRALRAGDYAVALRDSFAVVERKTLDGFANSLTDATLNYAMAELAEFPAAAVVVEGTYSALLRNSHAPPGYLADLTARVQVRYPNVPIVFVESRKLGEEWTFRFFKAAVEHDAKPELDLAPTVVPLPEAKRKRARRTRAPSSADDQRLPPQPDS
jgi:hypothetical protein